MRQTKLGSFYEACINVAIGFGINFTDGKIHRAAQILAKEKE